MRGRPPVVAAGAGGDRCYRERRQPGPGLEDAQSGWSREGRALRVRVEKKQGLGVCRDG